MTVEDAPLIDIGHAPPSRWRATASQLPRYLFCLRKIAKCSRRDRQIASATI
jgi:hypothetical protein